MSILSSFQNLLLGLLVVRNPGNVLSFYPGIWIRNSSHFLLPWSSYSQFNLISRIRNITSPLKLHVCLNSIKSVINYSTLSSFLRILLWNVALSIASFVSRSSIFLFVLHILINDFFSLSHKLMYKSSTSVTEVIQRKSACSYLCLPNSGFNIFFLFLSASLESCSCSGVFIASFLINHLSCMHSLFCGHQCQFVGVVCVPWIFSLWVGLLNTKS